MKSLQKLGSIMSASLLSLTVILRSVGELLVQIEVARRFGANNEVDAFYTALVLPNTVVFVLITTLRNIFLPTFVEQLISKSEKEAWRFVSNLSNLIILGLSLITILLIFTVSFWMPLLFPGIDGQTLILSKNLSVLILPIIIINAIIAIIDSIFLSKNMFFQSAVASAVRVIVYVGVVFLFIQRFGIYGLALAILVGYLASLLIQVFQLTKIPNYYQFLIDFKMPGFGQSLILWIQFLFLSMFFRFSPLIDRFFASQLGEGAISHLSYGNLIISMAGIVTSGSIGTVFYSQIASSIKQLQLNKTVELVSRSIRASLFVTIPVVTTFLLSSKDIISLIFERGKFGSQDSASVATIVILYSGTLIGSIITSTTSNVFYSMKSIKFLALQALIVVSIQIFLILSLISVYGINAIPLANSISFIVGGIVHLIYFHWITKKFSNKYKLVIDSIGKLTIALILALLTGYAINLVAITFVENGFLENYIFLTVKIIIPNLIYLISAYFLKIEEMRMISQRLSKLLFPGKVFEQ